jgi:(E)-4-hydroxy-3-methylbut-2-enyl-diphosphate synthase
LFNIQETLEKIKEKTGHLVGLKIAVMGCIVNGPGEMADADYGYVGAGKGKVMLYKGQQLIEKNVDEDVAVEKLIKLIQDQGDWKERDA